MDSFKKGLIFTIVLSLVLIMSFYGSIVKNPDHYYFASGGDGFKSYYGAIYHLENDSTYFQFQGMNYPYGESVFFTDNQPLLTNIVKLISDNVIDIREHIVGIINLSMIFSILIAAIFLYLLFFELEVEWWFASLASVGICMLSPQIGRMAGHFSLSHLFWIPLMLYLILRFSRKPQWKTSIYIALAGFMAASMHLYFAAFYGLLITFYWLFTKNWLKENWQSRRKALLHWFVQVIVPFILIELIMVSTDQATDRTSHPYGFLVYRAHPYSVLLPAGPPYTFVPKIIKVFNHLDWEAYAFIGVTAFFGFLIGLFYFFVKLFKGKAFWRISENPLLTASFWASIVALLLSFGIPFIWGMEWLVDYIGPFRQLRALSRFSWLFFYVINVLVFYELNRWFIARKTKPAAIVIVLIAFTFLGVDGFYNVRSTAPYLANQKPSLEDKDNQLPANHWIKQIDVSQFQTIIPIPYFHIGSENIWIDERENALEATLIASLKTSLPTTAVMMGRTSISQTYLNYSLMMEPTHDYEILKVFRNKKDLLLLKMKNYIPNNDEQRILNAASLLTGNDEFDVMRLPFDSLQQIPAKYCRQVVANFNPTVLVEKEGNLLTDTSAFFYYKSYDDETAVAYSGKGAHQLKEFDWNTLFEQKLAKSKKDEVYLVSFWLKDFQRDAYPRFNIEISQADSNGQTLDYFYSDIHRYIRATDQDWALFEIPLTVKQDDVAVKVSIQNKVLRHANYTMDELLIHRNNCDAYQREEGLLIKNTRKFRYTPH